MTDTATQEFLELLDRIEDDSLRSKQNYSNLFAPPHYSFNIKAIYLSHFGKIPNTITCNNLQADKFHKKLLAAFESDILKTNKVWDVTHELGERSLDEVVYFLKGELLVHIEFFDGSAKIFYQGNEGEVVMSIKQMLDKSRHRKTRTQRIHVVLSGSLGLELKSMPVVKPKLSLEDNYNDDFIEVHKVILTRLRKKKEKGLVLLHGEPGTGKSYYIRYLLSKLNKMVIFLPPDLAKSITNPEFMSLMVENPDSVVVIEDAENLIGDRETKNDSPVSALLNVADGLLSDCLNIQVICSFNTDLNKIDRALLRKGRLIARYEFGKLQVHKANALAAKLGDDYEFKWPTPLNEVYNRHENHYGQKEPKKTIGF